MALRDRSAGQEWRQWRHLHRCARKRRVSRLRSTTGQGREQREGSASHQISLRGPGVESFRVSTRSLRRRWTLGISSTSSKSRHSRRSLNFCRTRILGYSHRFGFGLGFPANFAPLLPRDRSTPASSRGGETQRCMVGRDARMRCEISEALSAACAASLM